MKAFLSLLVCLSSSPLWAAERATIQQIKDKRAIVRFDEDVPYSVGQEIFVNSKEGGELGLLPGQRNLLERRNSISLSGNVLKGSLDLDNLPTVDYTTYQLVVTYGWNFKNFELGPTVSLNIYDQDELNIQETGLGGFFEYNFAPNIVGEDLLYGLRADFLYSSRSQKANKTTNTNSTTINAGGFVKWFAFSPVLAVKSSLLYVVSEEKTFRVTGYSLSFGLEHYF